MFFHETKRLNTNTEKMTIINIRFIIFAFRTIVWINFNFKMTSLKLFIIFNAILP